MGKRTALYDSHVAMGAKLVDFAGWDMPIHYGSQLDEHNQVRADSGMFDVSHMVVVDLHGPETRAFLAYLLANDVGKLNTVGKALYSCMLTEQGGIIDDLIVYFMSEEWFRMVVNAGTRDKDLAWIEQQAESYKVRIKERSELAMIAIQGPQAIQKTLQVLPDASRSSVKALDRFAAVEYEDLFIARTGYTGEDGFEIILPNEQAVEFWQALNEVGVKPIGLGARDTLRLEAGMNLYGSDMNEKNSPLDSGLGWTVAWEPQTRNFLGRATLEQQKTNLEYKMVGLVLEGRGVLRGHQTVLLNGEKVGEITSGTFSPSLKQSIGLARVRRTVDKVCDVDIRGKAIQAKVVKYPFVRDGKACI